VQRPSTGPHRAHATAPHQDMCQDSRTGKLTSHGAEEHSATRTCTTTPGHHPRPPADRRPDAHRGTAAAGRVHARVLKPSLPTPPQTRSGRHQSRPRTSRHDRSDLHRHLETTPHPRHGESAVQVSSQCAIPAKEFPTLKLAAQQMPSRNSAHNADYLPAPGAWVVWLPRCGSSGYGFGRGSGGLTFRSLIPRQMPGPVLQVTPPGPRRRPVCGEAGAVSGERC
jgi:hypothetical protein